MLYMKYLSNISRMFREEVFKDFTSSHFKGPKGDITPLCMQM